MGPSLGSMMKPGRYEIVKDVEVTRERFFRTPKSTAPTIISVLKEGEIVQVLEYCEDMGGTMRGKFMLDNDLFVRALVRRVQAQKLRGKFTLDIYGWIDLSARYCARGEVHRTVYAKSIKEVSADSNEGCTEATGIAEDKPGADANATEIKEVGADSNERWTEAADTAEDEPRHDIGSACSSPDEHTLTSTTLLAGQAQQAKFARDEHTLHSLHR